MVQARHEHNEPIEIGGVIDVDMNRRDFEKIVVASFATRDIGNILAVPPTNGHDDAVEKKSLPMYTSSDAAEHLRLSRTEWREAGDLLKNTPEECVDGRCGRRGVMGTPGGNAGEFVLLLTAAERVSGKPLTLEEIERSFDRFLKHIGEFYMHTDGHAITHLINSILADKNFSALQGDLERAENLIRNGPKGATVGNMTEKEVENHLLRFFTMPENMGCGHLRLMSQEPEAYGTRREIVQGLVRAFIKKYWDRDDHIQYVPLDGDHEERAVFIIKTTHDHIDHTTRIPLITPHTSKGQAFVYHPREAEFLRGKLAKQMHEVGGITHLDLDAYNRTVKELGEQQLNATLKRLAKGKPVYTITFDEEGKYVVEGGEKVE